MRSMTFLAIVASVLSVVPVLSMSTRTDIVKNTYWTHGKVESDNSEIFLSIKTVVLEMSSTDNSTAINNKFNW